jgi:drug/metabolite transporter (DMT)-like permease
MNKALLGVVTLIAGLLILPVMDSIAKLLSGHLSTIEITWARFVFYSVALVPLAFFNHGSAVLRPSRPRLQIIRGSLLAGSAFMFFLGIARMPIADAMAVFFVYPFVILIVSAALLRESISAMQWSMVGLGFVGATLAAQPTGASLSPGTPFVLASAILYASALLATRRLSAFDPSLVTSAISAAVGALIFSCAVPFSWKTPALDDWLLMALMGAIAAIGHFMIIAAHRLASASQLAPYGYTEIASGAVCGFVIFGDWPRPVVWLGIALIVTSGVGATWHSARLSQKNAPREV